MINAELQPDEPRFIGHDYAGSGYINRHDWLYHNNYGHILRRARIKAQASDREQTCHQLQKAWNRILSFDWRGAHLCEHLWSFHKVLQRLLLLRKCDEDDSEPCDAYFDGLEDSCAGDHLG